MSLENIFLYLAIALGIVWLALMAISAIAVFPVGLIGIVVLIFVVYALQRLVREHMSNREDRYYEESIDR